jgi:hypothetical protein
MEQIKALPDDIHFIIVSYIDDWDYNDLYYKYRLDKLKQVRENLDENKKKEINKVIKKRRQMYYAYCDKMREQEILNE